MHLNIMLLDFFFSSLKIIDIVEGIKALHFNCNGMIHSWKGKTVWRDSLCPKSVWPTGIIPWDLPCSWQSLSQGELGVFPVRWGCPGQQGAPSIFSWSLCALHPSCLVDWGHLTRVLLAQKPQHLGMENPWCAVSQLCQCPAQPLDLGNTGWIVPLLERAVAWSHLPGLRQIIAPLSQKEWALMGSRIDRLAFGDYTSFFTNKKLILCVGSGINIAVISSNLTSSLHALNTFPGPV